MDLDDDIDSAEKKKRKEGEGISLPPFGLATYKMQGNVWVSSKSGRDQERVMSLLSVADSWLKQLRVQHHDFNYFTGIRRGWNRKGKKKDGIELKFHPIQSHSQTQKSVFLLSL